MRLLPTVLPGVSKNSLGRSELELLIGGMSEIDMWAFRFVAVVITYSRP